jgi:hypothetical protein
MLPDARTALEEGLRLLPYTDPDPQLADLEVRARRALDPLAPRPGSPSPVASPGASPPVVSTPSPVASPVALRVTVGPAVGQRERAP